MTAEKSARSPSSHGSGAVAGIGCGGCDSRWTGTTRCHCSASGCHQTFGGLAAFDRHRLNGKCLKPALLRNGMTGELLLKQNERGVWVTDLPADTFGH